MMSVVDDLGSELLSRRHARISCRRMFEESESLSDFSIDGSEYEGLQASLPSSLEEWNANVK